MSDFKEALQSLTKAENLLKVQGEDISETTEILSEPKRFLEVNLPVKMDDGSTVIFKGFRSQHNDILGPFKGGIRFHPEVNSDEVKSLSFWMTVKCAVAGLPFGGGKGGVIVDTDRFSDREIERLTRAYVRGIYENIGPKKDIPAPDVRTNPQIMAWFADEFSQLAGEQTPSCVTGKPVELGGSLGRNTATAQGGFFVLQNFLQEKNIEKPSVVVQGFGNAGMHFAWIASKAGFRVVAVSDSKGAVKNEDGLDVAELINYKQKNKTVRDFPGGENLENPKDIFSLNVDVLVPSALSNAIGEEEAGEIKAKIILELANGPVTKPAEEILLDRGVLIIPDVLANSGGVIVSYFEWVQNLANYYWTENEVEQKLSEKIKKASEEISQTMKKYNTDMRTACYVYAIKRIDEARKFI